MPNSSSNIAIRRFQCRHIFTDGHRCGSPCLRGENFCYYHHATRSPKPVTPPHDPYNDPPNQTGFTLPIPEDHSSVQLAIGTIMNRLAANELDPRRAGLLLYALQIASMNLKKAPRHDPDAIVQDVTLDPTQGPLAPEAEVPGDREYREFLESLDLSDNDDDDDDDRKDDDRKDEDHSGYRPDIRASAAPARALPALVAASTKPTSTLLTPASNVPYPKVPPGRATRSPDGRSEDHTPPRRAGIPHPGAAREVWRVAHS